MPKSILVHACRTMPMYRKGHWIPSNWTYGQLLSPIMWMLGCETGFSPRGASALNY